MSWRFRNEKKLGIYLDLVDARWIRPGCGWRGSTYGLGGFPMGRGVIKISEFIQTTQRPERKGRGVRDMDQKFPLWAWEFPFGQGVSLLVGGFPGGIKTIEFIQATWRPGRNTGVLGNWLGGFPLWNGGFPLWNSLWVGNFMEKRLRRIIVSSPDKPF